VAERLGVQKILGKSPSPIKVHEVLSAGLPRRAMLNAIPEGFPMAELLAAFGISLRTFMRLKADPAKRLGPDQSARVWRFAELLAKAEDVLGTSQRAVEWMLEPAMALEKRRPIDLLTSPVGAQLVDDVIERMRYDVYQ
jgi:putative toxin-antitoxin system antitoxin component (TIGR02293 family)